VLGFRHIAKMSAYLSTEMFSDSCLAVLTGHSYLRGGVAKSPACLSMLTFTLRGSASSEGIDVLQSFET
jgi:hypothetical protein